MITLRHIYFTVLFHFISNYHGFVIHGVVIDGCQPPPCLNGGVCEPVNSNPYYRCTCASGYLGDRCESPYCNASNPCHNGGTCLEHPSTGFKCMCVNGWEGNFCERNVNDCLSNPCKNGATCQDLPNRKFSCDCPSGFIGQTCEMRDPCFANPCHPKSKCISNLVTGQATCQCADGYQGSTCSMDIDECSMGERSPCENGGTCQNTLGSFQCLCVKGFSGARCETDIDECSSNPCRNGATCLDRIGLYQCVCPVGYDGKDCDVDINECSRAPCLHGNCTNTLGSFVCSCQSGWSGKTCNLAVCTCLNGGTCDSSGQCRCPVGFTGDSCELRLSPCDQVTCRNGGRCVTDAGGVRCECLLPWLGPSCSVQEDPCVAAGCANGASCVRSIDWSSAFCSCSSAMGRFIGARCDQDVDECSQATVFCPPAHRSSCFNTYGSYACVCLPGWTGPSCETRENLCLLVSCKNGGTCSFPSGACVCPPGFTGSKCEININDCLPNPCLNGGSCSDYVNTVSCDCLSGFTGPRCADNLNDCSESSCLNGGVCNDGINTFSCSCQPGFAGVYCQNKTDQCSSSPCENGGLCKLVNSTYFTCACPQGYEGHFCEKAANLCDKEHKCVNGGVCLPAPPSYNCSCPSSWSGRYCEITSSATCSSINGCKNGGFCADTPTGVSCRCLAGFSGSLCEETVNLCASMPCQNGGSCSSPSPGTYECKCPSGFQGHRCEFKVDFCKASPCLNSGECFSHQTGYSCRCQPGFRGTNCEQDINECLLSGVMCQNGATCVNLLGRFSCVCPAGFTGRYCEADLDECRRNVCSVTGTDVCVPGRGDYTCKCKAGYIGTYCSQTKDFCASNPCQNFGQCRNSLEGPVCTCQYGYAGLLCEFKSNVCNYNPCINGGSCVVVGIDKYQCRCPHGTGGLYCEVDVLDECAAMPCAGSSVCENLPGAYRCLCQPGRCGSRCTDLCEDPNHSEKISSCLQNGCPSKSGDLVCHPECDNADCSWDGGDCATGWRPWANCSTASTGISCEKRFKDGHCDEPCNTELCLFDGRDCEASLTSCPYSAYCSSHFANGKCDTGCNSSACRYDGGDCTVKAPRPSPGYLIFIINIDMSTFADKMSDFFWTISSHLRSVVRVAKETQTGSNMVYPLPGGGLQVYTELDTSLCMVSGSYCFRNVDIAAQSLAAEFRAGTLNTNVPVSRMYVQPGQSPMAPRTVLEMYLLPFVLGILCLLLFSSLFGVLYSVSRRKRRFAPIWFPEGFMTGVSLSPDSAGDAGMSERTGSPQAVEPGDTSQVLLDLRDNEMDDLCAPPVPKRQKLRPKVNGNGGELEPRVKSLGLNALHSLCMSGSDFLQPKDCENTADMVGQLLQAGFPPDLPAQPWQETALHLAARHCRSEAVRRLLEQDADPNAQDHMGRTPLHTAVASEASGAFQLLLRHGKTDVNARSSDGCTPLMTCVRLSIRHLDKCLCADSRVDVNLADAGGRSALHWAASVDNHEAVELLVRHGANKDCLDNTDATPLLVAAREGCRASVQVLLELGANRDLADQRQRTPRAVAMDRLHLDIVDLLDRWDSRQPSLHSREVSPQEGSLPITPDSKSTVFLTSFSPGEESSPEMSNPNCTQLFSTRASGYAPTKCPVRFVSIRQPESVFV